MRLLNFMSLVKIGNFEGRRSILFTEGFKQSTCFCGTTVRTKHAVGEHHSFIFSLVVGSVQYVSVLHALNCKHPSFFYLLYCQCTTLKPFLIGSQLIIGNCSPFVVKYGKCEKMLFQCQMIILDFWVFFLCSYLLNYL